MRTLSSRLVATTVLLVAVVSVLIGTTATLILRNQLYDKLDDQVRGSLSRQLTLDRPGNGGPSIGVGGLPGSGGACGSLGDGDGPIGQAVGTLSANLGSTPFGIVLVDSSRGCAVPKRISSAVLTQLADLRTDRSVHSIDLTAVGSYRLAAATRADGTVEVAGLPTRDVDDTVSSLIWWEALLTILGVAVAAGGGLLLVRRQLAPLREVAATAHEVATLPLDEGEVDLSPRVRDPDEATEVGQVGAALNQLLAHVESSLTARHRSELQVRRFVADASHELRTPLSTIRGYAELSRRTPEDPAALSSCLRKVSAEADRMSGLVDDLLLLARLDAGRPLAREPVDLTLMLLEAVADAQVVGPDHHWRLELPDEPVEVVGDEQRLHQVVTNLLANARRHTPAGSTITVSASAPAPGAPAPGTPAPGLDGRDRVEVVVADDGPGFPPDLVDRAFERFTRGDVSRTRAQGHPGEDAGPGSGAGAGPGSGAGEASGGAGLGLSIVAAIVRAHGGDVALVSRPGATAVTVRLPPGA